MNIINCTPHPLNIKKGSETITIQPSGIIPRVKTETKTVEGLNGFEVKESRSTGVEGLPAPEKDTIYVVSAMVAQATDRNDVVSPNTGEALRNEKGHIVAVPGFVKYV
jgi:hypothetical protein